MIRRGSIVVPTAPFVPHHPFQVEWAKGVKLYCYVGIVVDSDMAETDEWKPKKFPEKIGMSMAVTSQGMSQRRLGQNRQVMSNKVFSTGAKTGSVKIHCKSGFGRVVSNTAEPLDEQKGRAEWDESAVLGSGKPDSVYLVLHQTFDKKWCISWVNEADVEKDDVRIAVIKKSVGRGIKDWFLLQLWKSDLKLTRDTTSNFFQITAGKTGTSGTYRVKFYNDTVVDWNHYSNVSYRSFVPSTPWSARYTFYTAVINDVPLSNVDSTNPYFDITQTTYFFIEFTHTPLIGNGDIPPDQQTGTNYEWIADTITKVEIKASPTPMVGSWFDPPNTTSNLFRHQVGYVTIEDGAAKVTMQTGFKFDRNDMFRIVYGANWAPSSWHYDFEGESYVMDSPTTLTDMWFVGYDTQMHPLPALQ